MKSERLTERIGDGVRYDNGEYIITCYPKNNNLTPVDELAVKLCEFEDKKESGSLLELPCKVGVKVWLYACICDEVGKEKFDILEGEIISFSYQKEELWAYCRYKCGLTYWHLVEDFGKTLFLTKEEAEKALKEREKQ